MKKTLRKGDTIIIALLVFALTFILIPQSPARAEGNSEDGAFKEIEKVKNEQSIFMQRIEGLQNQSNNVMFSLEEAQDLISKNQQEITKMEKDITNTKVSIIEKKALRDNLMKEIYTDGGIKNIFYMVFSSASFGDFFAKKVNLTATHQKTLQQIKEVDELEQKLQSDMKEMFLKRETLQSQIDILENQLSYLQSMIQENYDAYSDLEGNRASIEGQLIDPGVKVLTQNKRDFIWWNNVDFRNQNSITFYGAGTAHGLGMSQYGAKAMADQGSDYEKILTHYYTGTHLGNIDTKNIIVRVRLSASSGGGNIFVRGGKANYIKGDEKRELSDGEAVPAEPGMRLVPQDSNTIFEIGYKSDDFNTYRGVIEILPGQYGGIATINHIYMEDYLRSVISGEMSARWPEEALKAQAVAARNYAYKNLNSSAQYDICDTPACQVYLGYKHEFPSTDVAVAKTKGEVLYYGNELITAYYFSSSGGWTENNENVWGGKPIPYLRGVSSPGEDSPYNSWKTDSISKEELQRVLNSNSKTSIGNLQKIEVTKRGVSGRVMAVRIMGSDGEKTVSGNTFKNVVNLGLSNDNYLRDILFGIR